MSPSVSVQPHQAAQGGQPAPRKPRRTNREMVLQPLWEGYLRAIQQQLRRSADFGAPCGIVDHHGLRVAAAMLDAFAAAVGARRYVEARRTKAGRARYEHICLLLSQIEHTIRAVDLARSGAPGRQARPGADTAVSLIERAIAELPKLDQIAGVAVHLGFAPCLGEMVSGEMVSAGFLF